MSDEDKKRVIGRPFSADNPPPNKGASVDPVKEHSEAKIHRHMRSKARRYTDLALEALVEVASQSKNLAAKVDAAQELLTRGYGRPHVQHDGKEVQPQTKINVNFGDVLTIPGRNNGTLTPFQPKPVINGELIDESTPADGDD